MSDMDMPELDDDLFDVNDENDMPELDDGLFGVNDENDMPELPGGFFGVYQYDKIRKKDKKKKKERRQQNPNSGTFYNKSLSRNVELKSVIRSTLYRYYPEFMCSIRFFFHI